MARVKGAMMTRKRRNKVLKLAKGYWGAKSKHFKMANEQVMKSLKYAYTGRRLSWPSTTRPPSTSSLNWPSPSWPDFLSSIDTNPRRLCGKPIETLGVFVLHFGKLFLPQSAQRAYPVLRQRTEWRSSGYTALRIAHFRVINITAGVTDVSLHSPFLLVQIDDCYFAPAGLRYTGASEKQCLMLLSDPGCSPSPAAVPPLHF